MNRVIAQHFDALEAQLVLSPMVLAFKVIRREVTPVDGKIRVRVNLVGGGLLEFFEYARESRGQVQLRKYSFHWQSPTGELIRRWDNANHYPTLPGAPHHLHLPDGTVVSATVPDLEQILQEIGRDLQTEPFGEDMENEP